jgi:hypothetical protein
MSLAIRGSAALAQTPASSAELVTVENYNRAQSDVYYAGAVRGGAFGQFRHGRELTSPDQRNIIIRPNRDTLYSGAVFDLDAGPVTAMLPDCAPVSWGCRSSIRINTPGLSLTARAAVP